MKAEALLATHLLEDGYVLRTIRELPTSGSDPLKAYVMWIRRYILFHGKKHPSAMSAEEANAFLSFLAVDRHVGASTQNQALSALLFLYREVLQEPLPWLDDLVRVQRPERLPVVLTVDEVRDVIEKMRATPRLVAMLLYGSGLRLLKALTLHEELLGHATCRRRDLHPRAPPWCPRRKESPPPMSGAGYPAARGGRERRDVRRWEWWDRCLRQVGPPDQRRPEPTARPTSLRSAPATSSDRTSRSTLTVESAASIFATRD
jgi:hypothetical protein